MKYLIAIWLISASAFSYAACTTNTVTINGKFTVCTTCCDNYGNCNTTCF